MRLLIALLLSAAALFGQAWQAYSVKPDPPDAYLLVLRYWGTISRRTTGDSVTMGPGWVYLAETYPTLPDVKKRLDGLSQGSAQVVGLWRLDDLSRITVTSKDVKHSIPQHVEAQEWTTREWTVGEAKR